MDDVAILSAVRELVSTGEYLDHRYGRPGEDLGGGGIFRGWPGQGTRMYRRGSPEHLAAKSRGAIAPLPPLTPAPLDAVEEAEAVLAARLPWLLRRLYLEVGNGGFGPGYGILGLAGGVRDDLGRTAVDLYRRRETGGFHGLPDGVLPMCHWGCAVYSLVDCRSPDGTMWAFDPNPGPVEAAIFRQESGFSEWMRRWLEARLHQPALIEDPKGGGWRGATEGEMDEWAGEGT